MGNNPTHLSDCAVAFEAAVRELSRMYPPPAQPTSLTPYFPAIWTGQIKAHAHMIEAARYGNIRAVRMWRFHTRIPDDELEAVIALIYG
jgi:hypothetical protein